MNPINRFIYTLNRPIPWKRSVYENTQQWSRIRTGDVVECAVENSDGILYRVEEIFADTAEARVAHLDADGTTPLEHYTLALRMLRPLGATALDER